MRFADRSAVCSFVATLPALPFSGFVLLPGKSRYAFLYGRGTPFLLPSGNRGDPVFAGPQGFPRPQVTHLHRGVSGFVSAPSRSCKGVFRRCRDVESVRCPVSPPVLNASQRGKPPPIVWISHCPGVLNVDHYGLDLIQKKAASMCDPVSLVFCSPLRAWEYGRASASHSFSMRQRRGRCA